MACPLGAEIQDPGARLGVGTGDRRGFAALVHGRRRGWPGGAFDRSTGGRGSRIQHGFRFSAACPVSVLCESFLTLTPLSPAWVDPHAGPSSYLRLVGRGFLRRCPPADGVKAPWTQSAASPMIGTSGAASDLEGVRTASSPTLMDGGHEPRGTPEKGRDEPRNRDIRDRWRRPRRREGGRDPARGGI